MSLRAIASVAALLLVIVTYSVVPDDRQVSQTISIEDAIQQLSSANEYERHAAKNRLIEIGEPAVQPLIDFLQDMLKHPRERYATGTAKAEVDKLLRNLKETSGRDSEDRARVARQLKDILINQRLEEDVCALLGLLHEEKAVPVLIEAMDKWPGGDSWENVNGAMKALIAIGSPAVPKLLEGIRTAEQRASAIPFGDGHPSDYFIRTETFKYQARASMVLGQIGDARAISTLEQLEKSTDSQWLASYVSEALSKIKSKHD